MSYPEPIATDRTKIPFEVNEYKDIGWELEVRYDKVYPEFKRQPYTGNQEKLEKKQSDLQTIPLSFTVSHHPQAVFIYEHLMSRKVTDFSTRAPFAPKGEVFETHMVRFQYPRPSGVVLGIPGQSGEANRNGYRFELYNTDEFLHIPLRNPLYQSWPILFHKNNDDSGWVCIFHDNPSRTFIDIGDFYEDTVTFESLTGNTRVYIICGKTLQDVSNKLTILLGVPQFPPLWAFGYQQCRFSYMSTQELRSVVLKMKTESIPIDAIYCDIDIFDGFRVFTKNKKTFSDLPETSQVLQNEGVHTLTIMDPGVKVDEDFWVYKELKKSGGYLKNADGSDFIGKVWPGDSLYPDFSNPHIQDWWANLQKHWVEENNLSGVWNDMNEPSNFDGMGKKTSQSFWSHGKLANEYNIYGYYQAQASAQGWRKSHPNTRGLIITRSGYPGVQKHAVIWHGDNCAWWEHLRLALHTAVSYSLCGAYYTGADIPGFTGNPPDDLAIRFFQLGATLPFFRGHSIFFAKDKEPYAFGLEVVRHIRNAIYLRYSLLREWYSGFEHSIRTKQSPLFPVFDKTGQYIPDQFLLFDKFLVAPVLERDERKKLVYLPAGLWYPLGEEHNPIHGDQWLILDITLASLPIFVKGGSIITRNTVGSNTKETLQKKESYEIYKDHNGNAAGYWFSDDESTINDPKAQRVLLTYTNGKVKKRFL
jgi:alpha-glucosidase